MKAELRERFSQAVELHKSGELQSARQMLMLLSSQDPNSPAIMSVLGDVCWELELRDEAVTAFRSALELAPKLEAASLGLFHCLWELGRRDEAVNEMKRFQQIADSDDYRRIVKALVK